MRHQSYLVRTVFIVRTVFMGPASIIEAQICDSLPICNSLLMTPMPILARYLRLVCSVLLEDQELEESFCHFRLKLPSLTYKKCLPGAESLLNQYRLLPFSLA